MTSRPPFTIERLEHLLLLVQGMDEVLTFYEGVLGATVESRLDRYAMVELRVGGSHLDLVDTADARGAWARSPVAGGRNIDHFAFKIGRADETALREHLAARAVPIVEERRESDADGESLSLYVRDPSGNTIELIAAVTPPRR